MRPIFVASNPSHRGPNSPAKRNLHEWCIIMGIKEWEFVNVSPETTPSNRPLKRSEYDLERLRKTLDGSGPIVALGNTASDALDRLGMSHFKLPHPSPRNRLLNDRVKLRSQLDACSEYVVRSVRARQVSTGWLPV